MTEHCHHHDHEADCLHVNRYQEAFNQFDTHVHDEDIHAAVCRLLEEKKAQYDTPEVKKALLGTIELTTLKVTDSQESVLKFTEKVNAFADAHPELPHLATICVYPNFAKIVSESLEADNVEVACVSGGFPSSQTFLEVKTIETALAVHDGATEIDMVLNVGAFLSGDYETCADEIEEIKSAAAEAPLKVILETGALQTAENIKKASILSIYAGADFIKTSTGKIEPAATPEAALVMCQTIREYYKLTGTKIGFKAAGGINTVSDAVGYYTIVREILGEEWIKEGLFRIGTSRLANLLVSEILGENCKPF
ncbi:MAG: deoxyribose-phosphate aldolase [Alloprevotella sp.]|nr:deoxyribose-phosphate aldolase [Prevotellamassilia sp.]MCI6144635.1 deoxyribose-phosphate aldolase [Bacteroidales bacterium]MDY2624132.1 deoxyribose-phosphate aldolase [Alloprevotella sp.]MDD7563175.1 deoxyribose-phosphate aldolase [Prevotellamassilia sp.]MDY2778469.1 deoxyribose-phosphate aldolase [Alloprevotella sp.]